MHSATGVERGTPGKPSSKGAVALVRRVLSGPRTTADARARLKGYLGDSRAARTLGKLPGGWLVFQDVGLMDERIDYVVAGPRGVFAIDVWVDAGTVVANARGLFYNGRRNNRPIEQAMRQAGVLEEKLGVEVKPVLAVVGADLTGREVDGLPVLRLDDLAESLLNDDGRRLSWEDATRVLDALGAMTR